MHCYFLTLLPGIFAICVVLAIFSFIFITIIENISFNTFSNLLIDKYFWKVAIFTFKQSIASSLISNFLAVVLSCSIHKKDFFGYKLILYFFKITLSLPTIVGIFGIVNVFGLKGWISSICRIFHISYNFSLYGISGILLVHIFFNLPLATLLLLCELENIPIEQRKISIQLNMSDIKFFYFVELPYLSRKLISVILLTFILCFTSFSTIFILGGNPRYSTISTEIYQSVYNFNFECASALSIIQMIFLLILFLCMQFPKTLINFKKSNYYSLQEKNFFKSMYKNKIIDKVIFLIVFILVILPILSIIVDGLQFNFIHILLKKLLWKSIITSLLISFISSFICLCLILLLLYISRELYNNEKYFLSKILDSIGLLVLIVPNSILVVVFFLKINSNEYFLIKKIIFISVANAFISIPYGMYILNNTMKDIVCYKNLCDSLNINRLSYFYIIEFRILKKEIIKTMFFIGVSSFGDFGIISIIGSEDFQTLPLYFYQNMGNYCSQDSFGIALFLIILNLLLLKLSTKFFGKKHYDIFG